MVAVASVRHRQRPSSLIFVLESAPRLTVFSLSYPEEGASPRTNTNLESSTGPVPPCESWSGFFVKGIGGPPSGPVVLTRWKNDDEPSRSIWIDPLRHTLVMRPVLRFSTREVKELRNRKATFVLAVTLTPGAEPFVLLGLVRRPNGSYYEAVFVPKAQEQGWGGFIHTPGENSEISFYALDDPTNVCRTR